MIQQLKLKSYQTNDNVWEINQRQNKVSVSLLNGI